MPERAVVSHDTDEVVVEEVLRLERSGRRPGLQRHVCSPVGEHPEDVAGRSAHHLDPRRAGIVDQFDDRRRQPGRVVEDADGDEESRFAGRAEPPRIDLSRGECPFARVGGLHEALCGRREDEASTHADREWKPESSFGLPQPLTRSRLGDGEPIGGATDGSGPGQLEEELVVGPVQHIRNSTEKPLQVDLV